MTTHTGNIDCEQSCEIPEGIGLIDVPRPRHAWGDVLLCPHDGCERAFMKTDIDGEEEE